MAANGSSCASPLTAGSARARALALARETPASPPRGLSELLPPRSLEPARFWPFQIGGARGRGIGGGWREAGHLPASSSAQAPISLPKMPAAPSAKAGPRPLTALGNRRSAQATSRKGPQASCKSEKTGSSFPPPPSSPFPGLGERDQQDPAKQIPPLTDPGTRSPVWNFLRPLRAGSRGFWQQREGQTAASSQSSNAALRFPEAPGVPRERGGICSQPIMPRSWFHHPKVARGLAFPSGQMSSWKGVHSTLLSPRIFPPFHSS